MDPLALVTDEVDAGRRLLDALTAAGVEVRAAFWAKIADRPGWRLHIATPGVNEDTPYDPYAALDDAIDRMSAPRLDRDDVRLIGSDDTMTRAAEEATRPKPASGPFAVPNPKPYPGMTRYNGSSFGGVGVEGVLIYPPLQPAAAV